MCDCVPAKLKICIMIPRFFLHNDLTRKTSSKLNKDVISQKLNHSAYPIWSVTTFISSLIFKDQYTTTLKMADHKQSYFFLDFTMSICVLGLKQLLINLLIHINMAMISSALRSYLKLLWDMSFIVYQIKKLVVQRIMVETALKSHHGQLRD